MIYRFNNQTFRSFPEYKRALQNSESRNNAYRYWSKKDDDELLSSYTMKKARDLADHFRRTVGAIRCRIQKLTKRELEIDQNGFFKAVMNKANPITGEELREDSIYLHPQIKKDIELYIKKQLAKI